MMNGNTQSKGFFYRSQSVSQSRMFSPSGVSVGSAKALTAENVVPVAVVCNGPEGIAKGIMNHSDTRVKLFVNGKGGVVSSSTAYSMKAQKQEDSQPQLEQTLPPISDSGMSDCHSLPPVMMFPASSGYKRIVGPTSSDVTMTSSESSFSSTPRLSLSSPLSSSADSSTTNVNFVKGESEERNSMEQKQSLLLRFHRQKQHPERNYHQEDYQEKIHEKQQNLVQYQQPSQQCNFNDPSIQINHQEKQKEEHLPTSSSSSVPQSTSLFSSSSSTTTLSSSTPYLSSYLARTTPPMSPVSKEKSSNSFSIECAVKSNDSSIVEGFLEFDDMGMGAGSFETEDDLDNHSENQHSSIGDFFIKSPNQDYVERKLGVTFETLQDDLEKAAFTILELGYESDRFSDATEDDDTVSLEDSETSPRSRSRSSDKKKASKRVGKAGGQLGGKNCHYSQEVIETLNQWFMEHVQWPFPNSAQKSQLCKKTGLNRNQLVNWFVNSRRRKFKEYQHLWQNGRITGLQHT